MQTLAYIAVSFIYAAALAAWVPVLAFAAAMFGWDIWPFVFEGGIFFLYAATVLCTMFYGWRQWINHTEWEANIEAGIYHYLTREPAKPLTGLGLLANAFWHSPVGVGLSLTFFTLQWLWTH